MTRVSKDLGKDDQISWVKYSERDSPAFTVTSTNTSVLLILVDTLIKAWMSPKVVSSPRIFTKYLECVC